MERRSAMDKYWVEVTICETVEAESKDEAEKKGLSRIPKMILDRFRPNVEVTFRGSYP